MATYLESLQTQLDKNKDKLNASNTAYANNVSPTFSDKSLAKQSMSLKNQIEGMKSNQLRNKWYGSSTLPSTEDTGSQSDSWFKKGIKALQRPMNTGAGAVQYALGQGTDPSFWTSLKNAADSGLTYGNILEKSGAPRAVHLPLGFALDVMFDPVNWATVGTEALVPRVASGLIKGTAKTGITGGAEAAKVGLTSGLARKASAVLNFFPGSAFKKAGRIANLAEKTALEDAAVVGTETVAKKAAKKNIVQDYLTKGAQKYEKFVNKVDDLSIKGTEKYDELMGTTIYDKLAGKSIMSPLLKGLGVPEGKLNLAQRFENAVKKIPSYEIMGKKTPSGEKIAKFFKYSVSDSIARSDLSDVINKKYEELGALARESDNVHFKRIEDYLDRNATVQVLDDTKMPVFENGKPKLQRIWADNGDPLNLPDVGNIFIADTKENAKYLLDMAKEDGIFKYDLGILDDLYNRTAKNRSGWNWWDKKLDRLETTTVGDLKSFKMGSGDMDELAKIKKEAKTVVKQWNTIENLKKNVTDMRPFEAILIAERSLRAMFKLAKVPMNPSSHVVANLGNAIMAKMFGIPVEDPEFMLSMWNALQLQKGKLGTEGLEKLFFSQSLTPGDDVMAMAEMMRSNPSRFKNVFGVDPKKIIKDYKAKSAVSRVNTVKTDEQIWDEITTKIQEEVRRFEDEEMAKTVSSKMRRGQSLTPTEDEFQKAYDESHQNIRLSTQSEQYAADQAAGITRTSDAPTGFAANEIVEPNTYKRFKEFVAREKKENALNPVWQVIDLFTERLPKNYERIDQTWKIATTDYLSRIGLTEADLIIANRSVPLTAADLMEPYIKNGRKYYRIKPLKASHMALEAYMDYSAMPEFVKFMRSIPIVGSPFFSFPYAMAIKTSKTAINNPALFNKVGFLMNETTGIRTPEEKAALESKYNQYLNSDTVVRMFGKWNTDVKNWVPYYTLNMFNPSQRNYDTSTFGGKVLNLSDKFPILQTPGGQILKDYYIQPWLLSGSNQTAVGQFGQPLFQNFDATGKKINVGAGTRSMYAIKTALESLTPGGLSFAGPLLSGLPPEVVGQLPYTIKGPAFAAQGRSSLGIQTKENVAQKTLRSLLGKTGIPAYPLETNYTNN